MTKKQVGRPKKYTKQKLKEIADKMVAWFEESEDNIFFKDFLLKEDIYGDMLAQYAAKDEYFSRMLAKCKKMQELKLLNGAVLLKKGYNAGMVKFILINDHGYVSEKSQQQIQVDSKDIKFNFGNQQDEE